MILAPDLRNHQKQPKKRITQTRFAQFFKRYGIFQVAPGESSCPDGSEYVWPQPLFAQKAFVLLCIPASSPFTAYHNISLRFRAKGRKVTIIHFSRISIALFQKIVAACCGLNFDATDLPNSQFGPLYTRPNEVNNNNKVFLAVQDSSIGDLVTQSVSQSYSLLKNTTLELSERLVTLATFDQSDEETRPEQHFDKF